MTEVIGQMNADAVVSAENGDEASAEQLKSELIVKRKGSYPLIIHPHPHSLDSPPDDQEQHALVVEPDEADPTGGTHRIRAISISDQGVVEYRHEIFSTNFVIDEQPRYDIIPTAKVLSWVKAREGPEGYEVVKYQIEVTSPDDPLGLPRRFEKRYNDFRILHQQLQEQFSTKTLPTLPAKMLFRNPSESALNTRRLELDNYLKLLLADPEVSKSSAMQDFLAFSLLRPDHLIPSLRICILIVGSRGDVQPFIALGMGLARKGHRVRLATHESFREFVTSHGLDFYPIAGDPKELMRYMVKNPGLFPSNPVKEVPKKREFVWELMCSAWDACTQPSHAGTDSEEPFIAEALISNPVAYAHIHVAEKLQIPLHMYFTMPWSPTRQMPHPLVAYGGENQHLQNYVSYYMIDELMWIAMSDLINEFRERVLRLEPINLGSGGASLLHDLKVPHAYAYSADFLPKPLDWGRHIDVTGYYFLDELAMDYEPPADLKAFLDAGEPPIYIGFGSIVVDNFVTFVKIIIAAVQELNLRAIFSIGWSDLGSDYKLPESIFNLESCPHDWLFPRCSVVIHHGGAGTVAAGLRAGKPTIVVPFFGDQKFWGKMIASNGAGPEPIPLSILTQDTFKQALQFCLNPEVKQKAELLGSRIRHEDGIAEGVRVFHKQLPLDIMTCEVCERMVLEGCEDIKPSVANVFCHDCQMRFCRLCDTAVHSGTQEAHKRTAHRFMNWSPRSPTDVVEGVVSGVIPVFTETAGGLARIITAPLQGAREHGAKGAIKGVGKGLFDAVTGPIKGTVILLDKLGDGLRNTPASVFGTGAKPGGFSDREIENVGDGFVLGAECFMRGFYDGITGLVVEPIKGAKEGGFIGGTLGFGKGLLGVVCQPVAGTCALIVKTAAGVKASSKSLAAKAVTTPSTEPAQEEYFENLPDIPLTANLLARIREAYTNILANRLSFCDEV
eukprot:GILK01006571.1.p1 GENE.GILK01006571.1~~GILK01006571.1.p1  ORF type:complete len:965 (-),score=132.21 GILK01006571.1:54-2915(-)